MEEFSHLDKVCYTVVIVGGSGRYSCYQSVQSLLILSPLPTPSLLFKNIKIKLQRTVILPVVLYGLEILSLTLSEECRLTVFKNRVLKKIWA
jgi:hypothetical protein